MYIITTIIFAVLFIGLLVTCWIFERHTLKKTYQTRNITLMALLIALSVILTNLLSYSFIVFGGTIRLAMGNFLLFVTGMIFGPFAGMVSGLLSDTLGTLINNGGAYHFGFAFAKALFGLSGGLVFIFKNNKWLFFKMISFFTMNFVLYSFVISPLSVAALYDNLAIGALIGIGKLVRLPIELAIYLPLTFLAFGLLAQLLQRSRKQNNYLWFLRNGPVLLKPKKQRVKKDQVPRESQGPESPAPIVEQKELVKTEEEKLI